MEFFYFNAPDELNNFVIAAGDQSGAEFLESWAWGEIIVAAGQTILRVGAREKGAAGKIKAAATLIKTPLFGPYFYWYSPRGPVGEQPAVDFLLAAIKKINRRAVFWRFEPGSQPVERIKAKAGKIKVKKTLNLQPAKTLFLDLEQSAAELLTAMQQKTRYNIRLAEKKGVSVILGDSADIPELQRLLHLTGQRDKFRLHAPRHYENLVKNGRGLIRLFLARYQGKNIAAALVSFFGDRVTYLHGASDNASRAVMAPQLLQWEIIKQAKSEGYKHYDFYGLDAVKWPGVTRFKLGFGGEIIDYPGTFDAVYRPLAYNLYQGARKLKRLIG